MLETIRFDVGTTSPSFTYGDDKGNQTTILQSQTLRILKISRYVLVPKFSLILEYYLQLYYNLKCHKSHHRPLRPSSLAQFGCALSLTEIDISYKAGSLGTPTGTLLSCVKNIQKMWARLRTLRVESHFVGGLCERDSDTRHRVSLQGRVLSWRLGAR